MFRSFPFALAAAALAFAPTLIPNAAAAGSAMSIEAPADQIAGTYDVKGENFAGAPYDGQVTVEKTGATYKVIWYPGPDQIEGIGVYWGGQFSVGYLQQGVQGVAVYIPVGGGLKGVWAERGETRLAPEDWTKR